MFFSSSSWSLRSSPGRRYVCSLRWIHWWLPLSRGDGSGSVRSDGADGEGDKDVVVLLLTTCRPPRTLDGSSDVNRSCVGGGGAAGVAAAMMLDDDEDEDAAAGFLFGGGSIFCARDRMLAYAADLSSGRARRQRVWVALSASFLLVLNSCVVDGFVVGWR
jgi:hypothetical protein